MGQNIATFDVQSVVAAKPNNHQQKVLLISAGGTTISSPQPVTLYSLDDFKQIKMTSSNGVVDEVTNKVTTFFANSRTSLDLLELGTQPNVDEILAQVQAHQDIYIDTTATPLVGKYYLVLLPDGIEQATANTGKTASNDFSTFLNQYTSTYAKIYFLHKINGGFGSFATENKQKCSFCFYGGQAYTGMPLTNTQSNPYNPEAAVMGLAASFTPNAAVKATSWAYRILSGVPPQDNEVYKAAVLNTPVNMVLSGIEGGLSTSHLYRGTLMDKMPFNYWYSGDWAQIQAQQAIANEILNGANDSANPLRYNQDGIDRLYYRIKSVFENGIFLALFSGYQLSAIPYNSYKAQFPTDVANGSYNGFTATVVPESGIQAITFSLKITNIPIQS